VKKRAMATGVAAAVAGVAVFAGAGGAANGHANYRAVCPSAVVAAAHCDARVVTDANGNPTASSAPRPGSYGPAQFRTGYNLSSASATGGSGQTIAIVDAYDDPNIESDLAVYDNQYGLPACTTANGCFRKVNQSGGRSYPKASAGWALEISLDVETAHEICPNCKILLVEASSNSLANLGAAVNEAATLGATVISNSYGGSEYSGETTDQTSYFTHPGVPITASSGDGGYGVEFPAAANTVTAVGGTTLTLNSDNSYQSESAWSGSGSGCSAYVSKPSWQADTGCAKRTVADVSADADPNTGAAVYDSVRYQGQQGWFQVGGTSLAAPLVASVYALAGNGTTISGASPYANKTALNDITSGSNGSCRSYLCTAGTGYDGPTGLGSPNGTSGF
jgi:subtilase family serine protease